MILRFTLPLQSTAIFRKVQHNYERVGHRYGTLVVELATAVVSGLGIRPASTHMVDTTAQPHTQCFPHSSIYHGR